MKMISNAQLKAFRFSKQIVSAAALMACAVAMPKTAEALSFDIFLIAEHTSPTSSTSPLSITTQSVYQLSTLNSNYKATQVQEVTDFSFDIDQALDFSSLNDPASGPSTGAPNEPWLTDQDENTDAGGNHVTPDATYVNSEVSSWDNSGISGTTVDADEQLDLGRNSSVTFNSVAGGFTDLIIADLGGLNNFNLSLCPDAICTTISQIFGGFNTSVRNFLLNTGLFATSDTGLESNQDQAWLFRFDAPVTDFVSLIEDDSRSVFTGARMQADFVGVATPGGNPSPVPGPAGLPLLASGFVLLGWTLRRKKR